MLLPPYIDCVASMVQAAREQRLALSRLEQYREAAAGAAELIQQVTVQ